MLGDNHPFYMMRNHLIQSFNKVNSEALNMKSVSRKRTATDSTSSSTNSPAKIPRKQTERQDMATSSPQENKNKVRMQDFYQSRASIFGSFFVIVHYFKLRDSIETIS